MMGFEEQLEMFRREQEAAQQHFFTYLALHQIPAGSAGILDALNKTPRFWLTVRYGSLVATVIALGRIFDEGSQYTIAKLVKHAGASLGDFSRASLAKRKAASSELTLAQAQAYAKDKYELSSGDVREMKKAVKAQRATWRNKLEDIRNKVLAHREMTIDEEQA
ncbi:AbiU2 domain-containing protein, partial [Phyllobacterium sp. P5_D12]